MSQKFISIGLSDKCDIKITDVLLSDLQCVFNLKKEGIFLEDYMSKFGTYIKINKENININLNKIKNVLLNIY
jgi:pSer/pThr/pTyr-binding forkhead associated (FHA) protein